MYIIEKGYCDRCRDAFFKPIQDPFKYPQYDIGLRIFSYYVILFSSVDAITAYPLVVLLMVNNIYMGHFGKDSAEASKSWRPFIVLVFMKFLVSLAPILVALAVSNLVTVMKYSGFSSYFHSFVVPILLQFSSQGGLLQDIQASSGVKLQSL